MKTEFSGLSAEEDSAIEIRLWEYMDGTSQEVDLVETLIRENNLWRIKYEAILEMNTLLAATDLEHPSMRFTKNIMESIAQYQIAPATKKYIDSKIIWGISLFFAITIVGSILYSIKMIDWSATPATKNSYTLPIHEVDYTKIFSNAVVSGVMMFNVLLGLFLLDRFLNAKRKKMIS